MLLSIFRPWVRFRRPVNTTVHTIKLILRKNSVKMVRHTPPFTGLVMANLLICVLVEYCTILFKIKYEVFHKKTLGTASKING